MNIDPRGMTFTDWSDRVNGVLVNRTPWRFDGDESEWREWAQHLKDHPDFQGQNIPQPEAFADWEEWAMRFNQTVELPG
ncbi:hypothetical protein [[Eubacterium] cellulosolvens]